MSQGVILLRFFLIQNDESKGLNQESEGPGYGIGQIQTGKCMVLRNLEYSVDPSDSDTAYTQYRNDHWYERGTETPQGTGGYVHNAAQEIRERQIGKTCGTVDNGLGRVGNIQA